MAHVDDVKRATAVINTAIQHKMFQLGSMPESDADKIVEAEKLVAICLQVKQMVDVVGASKVPTWPAVRDILFEAEVLVGANGTDGTAALSVPEGAQSSPPILQPSSSSSPSSQQPVPTSPAPTTSAPAMTTQPVVALAAPSASPSSSPPASKPPEQQEIAKKYQPGQVYSTAQAGQWEVIQAFDDGRVEAKSLATGQPTVLPPGFLLELVGSTTLQVNQRPDGATEMRVPTHSPASEPEQPVSQPVVEHIELRVTPEANKMAFTHPGCSTWVAPLDDVILPALYTRVECAGCGMPFPLTVIEPNGYVSPHQQPKEEPSTTSFPSQQGSPPDASSSSSSTPSATTATGPASVTESRPSQPPTSQPIGQGIGRNTGAPVDDAEGDEVYAALLDDVDGLFTPPHFPIPHDLENPPELMPDDLTLGEVENRRLHSQYNALSARARYLWQIDHLKAKRCGRMVKSYMKPAMRLARTELGKDATVAEVKMVAEEDENVIKWQARQEMHADRAEAYREFFEVYAENVRTLSRDLTYAVSEEKGS